MPSLRCSVMENSFLKSLRKHQEDPNVSQEEQQSNLDSSSKSTPGLPTQSCARARVQIRKRKNMQKPEEVSFVDEEDVCMNVLNEQNGTKNTEQNVNKEKEICDITDVNYRIIEKNINKNDMVQQPEESEQQQQQLQENEELPKSFVPDEKIQILSKLTKQELVDSLVEYQYKYERLSGIVNQLKENIIEITSSHQKQHQCLRDAKNILTDNLYNTEGTKFQLEEEVQKLSSENEQMKTKIKQLEEKQDIVSNEKLHKSTIQQPSTPKALSRSYRRSMFNQTLKSLVNDQQSIEELYQNVAIEQKEVLDFYSLLTGLSVWKEISVEEESETNEDEVPINTKFKCKLQQPDSSLDGYQFDLLLKYADNEIEYTTGCYDNENSNVEKLPEVLKSNSCFNADEGFLFIKNILSIYDIE